ncbi:MAG: helix-turn-helix domain-containing protein [Ruminococcaceae bacterium]|nr:helix-turn-helix domain-containing protein [Oscillospiraceae bacterium]
MALLDRNSNIRLRDIQHLHFEKSSVYVAPRPYHALAFRVSGTALFSHDALPTKTAAPGSITYMPANFCYTADYTERNEIYVIHFDTDANPDIEIFELFSPQVTYNLFKNAHHIWNYAGLSYYHHAMSVFYEILANLSSQTSKFYKSELYKSFYEAVEFMKANYTDCSLTIDRLSKIAYMSNTYFRKLFFERFGETPSKYLTNLRIEHAVNLLSKGNLTISEVALLSGFTDTKYFCRVIKKIYGYPPSKIFIHKA